MTRQLTAAVQAGTAGPSCDVIHLVELRLDQPTGTIRLTDAYRNIVWGGQTYGSGGSLLGISVVEESMDGTIRKAAVQLSGVNGTYVSLLMNEHYIDRELVIYKALLDGSAGVVTAPILLFFGRVDVPTIEESASSCAVTVQASAQWLGKGRFPGRHTNDADQQIYFPGDTGFRYVARLMDNPIIWGIRMDRGQQNERMGWRGWR